MAYQILIIDASLDTQAAVKKALEPHYSLLLSNTVAEARARIQENRIHLIVLDRELPDGDGFEFCATLQDNEETQGIPVILLGRPMELPDRIRGYTLGADDCIAKPFDALELKTRVQARLQKAYGQRKTELILQRGDLRFNIALQRLTIVRDKGGLEETIDLTPFEFKLLLYFARQEDRIFSREELIKEVWGEGSRVFDRTVDMHVSNLRKKLAASQLALLSVHGVGYRFGRRQGRSRPSTGTADADKMDAV